MSGPGYRGQVVTVDTSGLTGPHHPLGRSATRRPGLLRRTSSIDTVRPDGPEGNARLTARARDILTVTDGGVRTIGEVALRVLADPGRVILELSAEPETAGLRELVGARMAGGFRGRLAEALPAEVAAKSLLNLILDDLPNASLVSHYSMQRSRPPVPGAMPEGVRQHIDASADICAGWARDGSIFVVLDRSGVIPTPYGPAAPDLAAADPAGWHDGVGELPAHGMRRRRLLDVDPELGTFHAHFRDSHVDAGCFETVVHEYDVTGTVATDTRVITAIEPVARVLPWIECPAALGSAQRLVGTTVGDLRDRVRADFVGVETCTHLNDVLRTLADVDALLGNDILG